MDDYSRKSKTYKSKYSRALSSLYGNSLDIDFKASKTSAIKRKKKDRPEQRLQIKIVQWLKKEGYLVFSIPNHGRRSFWQGGLEVQAGLTAGASDIFLSESNNMYHGFYIELKAPDKEPTELQYQFGEEAEKRGYKWAWFNDWDIAQRSITEYLVNR
jgi:hypothetical protein